MFAWSHCRLTVPTAAGKTLLPALFSVMLAWAVAAPPVGAQESEDIRIAAVRQLVDLPPTLSNILPPPEDEGLAGARLAIADNQTTGRFLGQTFSLTERVIPPGGDAVAAFRALVAEGHRFVLVDAPAALLLHMADAVGGEDVLIFNVGSPDDRLRDADCRDNVMHIAPSRVMLADGLAQYLARKRWSRWFLVPGPTEDDHLFAGAVRQAARKFGTRIVEERPWDFEADLRRTAQAEIPVFTQGVDYDVLVVADEEGTFGDYLMYRTWDPRLVAGTHGLTPTSWHSTHEQWGAAQLQSRFRKRFERSMTALDWQFWAAVRTVGEGATRAGRADVAAIRDYIRGPEFELGAFKGQPLTFRPWNWQLRQPVLLVQPRAVVSVSPQEGFLHQRSLLDTVGIDEPESACRL